MSPVYTVYFGDGDIIDQLFQLKLSALRNNDRPALWRLTDTLIELLLASARGAEERWPRGYISATRLFGIPVDYVREMPHLLCEDYVIYPYTVRPPRVITQVQ